MKKELVSLVQMAGTALEIEDQNIRNAVSNNKKAYLNEDGGILRIKNEGFYHYIILRSLFGNYPYAAFTQHNSRELVLKQAGSSQDPFAVVEMKHWLESKDSTAVTELAEDIEKLRHADAENKLMLLFISNPVEELSRNIQYLSDNLESIFKGKDDFWSTYRFSTVDRSGSKMEFWVGGYQIV